MTRRGLQILALVAMAVWAAVLVVPDRNLRVVFCDVGQGDAILVMRGTTQMLVDTGSGQRVVECLGRHLPFWDTMLEVLLVTHPDKDHAGGAVDVIKRYTVMRFVSVPVGAETTAFAKLRRTLAGSKIQVSNAYRGDEIKFGEVRARVIWPEREWTDQRVTGGQTLASGGGAVLGAKAVGAQTNDFSIGMIVSYGEFDVLLTGDGDGEVMEEQAKSGSLKQVEVAKAPHHGSKYAAAEEWWKTAGPSLAVVSVGKNSYGHPSREVVDLLQRMGIKTLRTDVDGDVEVVSDGKTWWVRD